MKKIININGKDYTFKYTIRAIFLFERIAEKPFSITSTIDNYIFFFCMLLANNPDMTLTWDDFIEALDNDSTLLKQLEAILDETNERKELLDEGGEEEGEDNQKKN